MAYIYVDPLLHLLASQNLLNPDGQIVDMS